MAKKEKRFKINMSINDFLDMAIEKSSKVKSFKDKEIITDKNSNKIILKKKLNETQPPNRPL